MRQATAAAVAAGFGVLVLCAVARPWLAADPVRAWQRALEEGIVAPRSARVWIRWAVGSGLLSGASTVVCVLLATRQDHYDDVVARGMAGFSTLGFGLCAGTGLLGFWIPASTFPSRIVVTTGDRVAALLLAAAACTFAWVAWRAPRGAPRAERET